MKLLAVAHDSFRVQFYYRYPEGTMSFPETPHTKLDLNLFSDLHAKK